MAKKESKHTGNLVGKKLGDYTLTSKLATGGMAHIYRGVDERLQRQAAVKVLTPEMMEADDTLTERFQREARAIAALEHDNIITIFQYGEQDSVYFLAMKYVAGMDLADELNRLRRTGEKMEIKRALNILEQVAAALDFAHTAGIIHRDVKPSNILLDQNDKAVLTDFGLVLRQSVDQTLGTAFGTPRYISPEQAVASENAVPQSDIYSLAVVMFEILTGQSVFKGATPMEMALSHINEPPPSPRSINPEIPVQVEVEILRALSKDAKMRHPTAVEFIHAVKRGYGMKIEQETNPTRPLGFAPPQQIPESKTPLLIEFGHEPEAKQAPKSKKTPAVKREKETPTGRSRWLMPLLAGLVGAGVLIIGVVLALGGTQLPSGVIPPPDTPAVVLYYTDIAFAMRNQYPQTLDISQLKFVRGSDDGAAGDDFYGSSVRSANLEKGKCIVVKRENRDITLDDEWGCRRNVAAEQVRYGPLLFWRGDNGVATFEVRHGDRVIATCRTVPRGAFETCVFTWDAFTNA